MGMPDHDTEDDHGGGRRGPSWIFFVLILVVLVVGVYALDQYNPTIFRSDDGARRLIYLALLLVIIGPLIFVGRMSNNIRNLFVWGGMLTLIAVGYAIWHQDEISSAAVTSELMPQRGSAESPSQARFVANRNGDFVVEALVQGVSVVFIVDTGASDVVLSLEDAKRVGLKPDRLEYTQRYQTANGLIFGAPVRLDWMSVGGINLYDVRASVPDSELRHSLLGMSFLNRIGGFEVRDGILTLYQ
jgi:aspartyl protease family protein